MNASLVQQKVWKNALFCGMIFFFAFEVSEVWGEPGPADESIGQDLARAKIYLAVGDYRRAVEACQRNIDLNPSVEAYVYLAYVYQAIDGYLAFLAKEEDYVKVEQLALNLTARDVIDLIDPPNVMARMAQELIHEGLRQQFDVTAAMANRGSRSRTNELWSQQNEWRAENPSSWWAGVPDAWKW